LKIYNHTLAAFTILRKETKTSNLYDNANAKTPSDYLPKSFERIKAVEIGINTLKKSQRSIDNQVKRLILAGLLTKIAHGTYEKTRGYCNIAILQHLKTAKIK
jgi:hypothetical protein